MMTVDNNAWDCIFPPASGVDQEGFIQAFLQQHPDGVVWFFCCSEVTFPAGQVFRVDVPVQLPRWPPESTVLLYFEPSVSQQQVHRVLREVLSQGLPAGGLVVQASPDREVGVM